MALDTWPTEMGWDELNAYVSSITDEKLIGIIKNPEITCKSILGLYHKGLRLYFDENLVEDGVMSGHKENGHIQICLRKGLEGYRRDLTIFHELVHVQYRGILDDLTGQEETDIPNNAIVEYLARIHRAKPDLLKTTINLFDLNPRIYDKPSLVAFSHQVKLEKEFLERQVPFKFAKYYFDKRRKYLKIWESGGGGLNSTMMEPPAEYSEWTNNGLEIETLMGYVNIDSRVSPKKSLHL